jgi:AcrR family transcriptional regulator
MIDKREHILSIAEKLFAEFGYEGTSTRMLAKEAGVNVAMISYYFGSKQKLFEALVECRTSYTREKMVNLAKEDKDPWLKLNEVIDLYVERILTNYRFHRIMYREVSLRQRSELTNNISQILVKSTEELIRIIKAGISEKVFREVDVEMTVATLFGTISQTTLSTSLSYLMLNQKSTDLCITDEKFKLRLKDHLHDLMRAHLTPREDS